MVGTRLLPDERRRERVYPPSVKAPPRHVHTRRFFKAGFGAALAAAAVNSIIFFIEKKFLGITFLVPSVSDAEPAELTIFNVLAASVIPAIAAALLLAVLWKFAREPINAFKTIATIFLFASLIAPFSLAVELQSKLGLSVMHIAAAIAIISTLSRVSFKESDFH